MQRESEKIPEEEIFFYFTSPEGLLLVWQNKVIEKLTGLVFYSGLITKTTPPPPPKQLSLTESWGVGFAYLRGAQVPRNLGIWSWIIKRPGPWGKEVGVLCERSGPAPWRLAHRDAEQQRGAGRWVRAASCGIQGWPTDTCTRIAWRPKVQFWFRRSGVGPATRRF